MAVDILTGSKPSGRPLIAAVIGLLDDDDDDIRIRDIFFRVCKTLSCSDMTHLANGLGITRRTVENWHYGQNYTDKGIAKQVIQWYENGKPVQKIYQCQSLATLY